MTCYLTAIRFTHGPELAAETHMGSLVKSSREIAWPALLTLIAIVVLVAFASLFVE